MSEPPTDWHLICITRKGKVSILKNLDLRTARETYKRLLPSEHPFKYKFPDCAKCGRGGWAWSEGGYSLSSDSDRLERVEAVGPEGEELNPWEGVAPYVKDMRHLCRCPQPAAPEESCLFPVYPTVFEERAMREAAQ